MSTIPLRRAAGLFFLALTLPLLTAATDWTRQVARSEIGGHVMGNPAAPSQLVEYLSYTCVHCARFTRTASAPIVNGWVRQGGLSVEIRNAVRDKYDLAAAMLARCGGPSRFYGNHSAIFANYDAWMKRVTAHSKLPPNPALKTEAEQLANIGVATGLYGLMQRRGFTRVQLNACIADKGSRDAILAMTDEAWSKLKIGGTPSFSLNGTLLNEVHDWESLRARLPASPSATTTASAAKLVLPAKS